MAHKNRLFPSYKPPFMVGIFQFAMSSNQMVDIILFIIGIYISYNPIPANQIPSSLSDQHVIWHPSHVIPKPSPRRGNKGRGRSTPPARENHGGSVRCFLARESPKNQVIFPWKTERFDPWVDPSDLLKYFWIC